MPDFLFLDRDGHEVGLIRRTYADWRVGQVIERPSDRYRVLEVIFPVLSDADETVDAYVLVEPEDQLDQSGPEVSPGLRSGISNAT